MARINLFKKFKGKDYKFIDRVIKNHIYMGGTDILIHKYLGPKDQPVGDSTKPYLKDANENSIQDLLFVENRDRKYEKDIYDLKGVYNVSDIEFNLSQFGIMLSTDALFITFHISDMVERLGRKLISGDVLEIWHKRDDLSIDENEPAINAFYVITDATKSAEGYSATWYPHLWRVKAIPLKDSQEYRDILDESYGNGTLKDFLSSGNSFDMVDDAIVDEDMAAVDRKNFQTGHLWVDTDGKKTGDNLLPYMFNGDGIPPNISENVECGRRFPEAPEDGEYFLRTDYNPARLFRRIEGCWKYIEVNYRRPYHPANQANIDALEDKETVKFGDNLDSVQDVRQPISKAVTPKEKIPNKDVCKKDEQ